uniref:Uncharacterized protein n=1 Tax=Caenorhabditis japonica TaxID=281687 RepID=A0A8R1DWX5_CAEJA
MTERSIHAQAVAAAKPIRIPRIAIAPSSAQLTGTGYMSPHLQNQYSATLPRHNDILTSPSYIADHLPSRRLSEIDSPFYLPTLLSSTAERGAPRVGYATTPLRIRTDVTDHPRFIDTATDLGTREYSREVVNNGNPGEFISVSEYPATSAVIGLTPPRMVLGGSEEDVKRLVSSDDVAETSDDVDRLALFNNASLGYQRFCYLLSRYPAIAMTIIATWMLWGRGLGLARSTNENVCYIVSFVGGVFILSSQVILSMTHGNSYKREKILANLYHFANTIGTLIAITAIVFAAISYQNVRKIDYAKETCTWQNPELKSVPGLYCFTPNERLTFLSILIGASGLVIMLTLFSGLYGCIGQSLMKKKRQTEFQKYAAAHDNAAFRF